MNILFRVTDPKGRDIVCFKERWEQHVLRQRPIMKNYVDLVKETIHKPDLGIFEDATDDRRNVYYRYIKARNLYMKVVVEFLDDGGTLITAHWATNPKEGEILIWTYSDH